MWTFKTSSFSHTANSQNKRPGSSHSQQPMEGGGAKARTTQVHSQAALVNIYLCQWGWGGAQEKPSNLYCFSASFFFFPSKTKLNLQSSTGDLCNVPLAAPLPEPVGGVGVRTRARNSFFFFSLLSHTQTWSGREEGGGQINSSSDGLCGKCGSISEKEGKKIIRSSANGCVSASACGRPSPE